MSRPRYEPWWSERIQSGPKPPPPEHGIKLDKIGSSWWGKRWIEALERALGAGAGRLSRGRAYARAGRTHDLVVEGGKVQAAVTGSRAEPYRVTIELTLLDAATWQRVIAAMTSKAQFAAELLGGRMPEGLDELFREAGTSLFPSGRQDLKTACTCPDWGDPCKHVAATHYVLGEAFDRDPFLLLELRGRTKEQVLGALRAARSEAGHPPESKKGKRAGTRRAAARAALPPLAAPPPSAAEYDAPRGTLPAIEFSFAEPASNSAVVRQLGAPAHWTDKAPLVEAITPLIRAAAERARGIALGDSNANDQPAPAMGGSERLPTEKAKRPSRRDR